MSFRKNKAILCLCMTNLPCSGLRPLPNAQHGYFTTSQARERGISSQLLSHYVRRNRFERVRRGLYRLPGFPRPEDDEMREKWMAVGADKAVLSHQSALALLDLSDNIPNVVHLLLGRRYRGLRRPAGVVIHTRPDEEQVATVWREGLHLTAPARTLVDVAGEIQPEQLEMALWQALGGGLLTVRQLEEEARRRGRLDAVSGALTELRARGQDRDWSQAVVDSLHDRQARKSNADLVLIGGAGRARRQAPRPRARNYLRGARLSAAPERRPTAPVVMGKTVRGAGTRSRNRGRDRGRPRSGHSATRPCASVGSWGSLGPRNGALAPTCVADFLGCGFAQGVLVGKRLNQGWIFSPRSSMATNLRSRRSRVSDFFASPRR